MAKLPMTIDLLASLDIVDDDVAAVVNAYMFDPKARTVAFGEGYRIDPASAVAAHPFARTLISKSWACTELQQTVVRAAIMLAQPERI